MIKTFNKAKEDFYLIAYYLGIRLNRMYNRSQANKIRLDMNAKVEELIQCIK